MELQWPLILFTTFVAASAGVFGTQAVFALKGADGRVQMPALVTSVALLAVGGIAVFFHLEHWERIFNGFGHLTSGITQELIAIVVFMVVAVVYFAMLRKSDEGRVPFALAVAAVVISVVLVVVCAHSYMMPARPAWNSFLLIVYMLGNACAFGTAIVLVIAGVKGVDVAPFAKLALVGAAVNAVTTLAYLAFMALAGGAFVNVGYYFDPVHPAQGMVDVASLGNLFTGDQALLVWLGVVLVGAVGPVVAMAAARKDVDGGRCKQLAAACVACVLVGAICLRVAFYNLGLSVFMFY